MKKCTKCEIEKELTEFHKCSSFKDGLQYWCKTCVYTKKIIHEKFEDDCKRCKTCKIIKKTKEFRKEQRNKSGLTTECKTCLRKKEYEYRSKNKERKNNHNKNYTIKNKELIKIKRQNYHKQNSEKVKKQQKESRYRNRDRSKAYRQKNKEKHNKYIQERKRTDPNFKITTMLRAKLHKYVKRENKSISAIKLIGCTIKEFKIHIEKQFLPGMTWENHGLFTWHIDHIRPCCSFDMTDIEQQKICFHYTNMRPLWAEKNLEKISEDVKLKHQKDQPT